MKAFRRFVPVLLALVFLAGGCWDYNEAEDLLFPMGLSLDRLENGRIHGALEISISKGEQQMLSADYIEIEGDTMHDVMINAGKIADKPLNWSHMRTIVVSQAIARDDMAGLVDMLMRMPKMRNTAVLAVSKEATAQEIIEAKNTGQDLNSFDIADILKAEKQSGKAPDVKLHEFADAVATERQSAILPAVELADTSRGRIIEVSGTAVFRGPWFQGILDEEDSLTLNILRMGTRFFEFPLTADPGGKYDSATVQLRLHEVDILPSFKNGRAGTNVYIKGDIVPFEISGASTDPKKFGTITNAILAGASTRLENAVTRLIRHTQEFGGCDVIQIGNRLRGSDPKTWLRINGQWRDIYNNMEIRVQAGLALRNTGEEIQPIAKGR